MPKICVQNGLGLSHVPDCLKLTNLENHMISKNLIFIIVAPCSKRSRYEKMHNRIVNVPIPDDDIIKSVSSLPRQANTSGLVNVQLKRKMEYKNSHLEQMVRPNILLEAVAYLKEHHPSYHDVNIQPLLNEKDTTSDMEDSESNSSSDEDSNNRITILVPDLIFIPSN